MPEKMQARVDAGDNLPIMLNWHSFHLAAATRKPLSITDRENP
jgi:hypothetical protein